MNNNRNVSERTIQKKDRYGNQTTETVKYDTKSTMNNIMDDLQQNYMDFVPQPTPSVPPMSQSGLTDLNDPTNRDSVIAALTPGEYVLNKEASQMYAPQVEAMNNHGLQQRHQENVAFMNGGQVPHMQSKVPPMQLNAGGRADRVHQINSRRAQDYIRAGNWNEPQPYYDSYPAPDLPHHEPARPTIKPSGRAGPPYYNTGGAVPPMPHFNDGGDVVIPGYFLGGLVDAAQQLFGGSATQVPNAGYADYSQQQFVDEANNPSRNVAPSAGQYSPQQPQVPEIPSDMTALAGDYNDRIARQQGSSLSGVNPDPFPSIDITPPAPGSDQAILQNSSQSTEKTEDNLLALQQGSSNQAVPQQDQGVPPMHQMPDGTMMPGASHQGGQPQQRQSSVYDTIAQHEGFRDEAYDDGTGVWTIGFGRITNPDGSRVKKGQTTTQDAEQRFLKTRVDEDKQFVLDYAKKHGYNWRPNQVDALTSFTYNLGKGGLDKLTAGGKRDDDEILNKIPEYNKAGGNVLQGLQNRRNDEAALFAGESYGKRYGSSAGVGTSATPTGFFDWDNNTFVDPAQTGLEELAGRLNTNVWDLDGDGTISSNQEANISAGGVPSGPLPDVPFGAAQAAGFSIPQDPRGLGGSEGYGPQPTASNANALKAAAFAGDETAQERLFELADAGDAQAAAIIDEFYARQDAGTLAEASSLLPYVAGTEEGRVASELATTVPYTSQGLVPPLPVETGLPTAKANISEIRDAQIKKQNATQLIQQADAEALEAEAGIQNATSVSELEKFQRMAEQAKQKKTQGTALDAEANSSQATIDQRAADATADSLAIGERSKAELDALRNKALIESGYKTPKTAELDAEGVVAAEKSIANAAGGTAMSNEEVSTTKKQITDTLTANGNRGLADSMFGSSISSVGGRGVNSSEVNKLINNADGPKGDGKSDGNTLDSVKGAFKTAFKDLFGSTELGPIIAKGLMLYAGARITGLSGNSALAFAAKSALADGAAKKQQANLIATETAKGQAAVNKEAAEELKWRKHKSIELGKDYTTSSIDSFIQTGDHALLVPKEDPNDTELGPATGKQVWSADFGAVDVRRNANGSGEFVRLPNGRELSLKDFQQIGVDSGRLVEDYRKEKHDFATIESNFHTLATDNASSLTGQNAQRGAKDGRQNFNSVPQQTARVASNYYKDLISKYPTADASKLQQYMYDGIIKYQDDLNAFQQGRSTIEPSSPEDYFKAQEVIIENDLPYDEVNAANPMIIAGIFDNVNADASKILVDNDSPTAAADYLEARKEGFQEIKTLWTLAKKDKEFAGYWNDIASASDNATPFTAFTTALLNSDADGDQSVAGVREVSSFVDKNLTEFQKRMTSWRNMRDKKTKR